MNHYIEKDKKRRLLYNQYELKRLQYKYIINNQETNKQDRFYAQLKLSKLPRNSSKTRIKNRCTLTGRAKAVYRQFKISRLALRELASFGMLPGVKKASW